MAMFPALTRRGTETHNPVVGAMESMMAHDPTIRSESEGGYVKSRARFTRIAQRWTVRYEWMSATNKGTLLTFEQTTVKGGSESFTWTNPANSTSYTVRFLGPIRYIPHDNANFLWWRVEFELEQV